MKYVLAALAVIGAVAALVFRPPHADPVTEAPRLEAPRIEAPRPERRQATTTRANGIVVYIAGEVTRPGVYAFRLGDRAQVALERAGGAKSDADLVAVNLAAPLEDGEELAVPKIGAPVRAAGRTHMPRGSHTSRRHGRRHSSAPNPAAGPSIDLNAAGVAELEELPGVGPALAQRIVDYRETNGPFTSIDELADVSGVSSALQEALSGLVTVR